MLTLYRKALVGSYLVCVAEAGADSSSVTSKLCLEARMSEAATPTGPEPTTTAF